MMPENQRNTADIKSEEFINYVAHQYPKTQQLLSDKILIEKDGKYLVSTDLSVLASGYAFKDSYKDFMAYGLSLVSSKYLAGDHTVPLPYFMTYNNMLVDKKDELYTHIDINFERENVNKETKNVPLKIRGIDEVLLKAGKSKITLSDSSINALMKNKVTTATDVVPVVINKYFSEYYNLGINDTFASTVTNMTNRYLTDSKPQSTFKVVGIENTYNDGKVYTLQNYANTVLGLNTPEMMAKSPLATTPFNGVMTSEKSPLLFNSLPLYSPSGIYPGKNFINLANTAEQSYLSINMAYFDKSISAANGGQLTFPNPKVTAMDQLMKVYGSETSISPMESIYSTVD